MGVDEFIGRLRGALSVEIPEDVGPHDGLYDDLGFDSFQAFELIVVVEAMADCLVPPPEIVEMYTLADAFAYYEQLARSNVELLGP